MLYVFFLVLEHVAGNLFPCIAMHIEFREGKKVTSMQHIQARLHATPHGTVWREFIVQTGSHEKGGECDRGRTRIAG